MTKHAKCWKRQRSHSLRWSPSCYSARWSQWGATKELDNKWIGALQKQSFDLEKHIGSHKKRTSVALLTERENINYLDQLLEQSSWLHSPCHCLAYKTCSYAPSRMVIVRVKQIKMEMAFTNTSITLWNHRDADRKGGPCLITVCTHCISSIQQSPTMTHSAFRPWPGPAIVLHCAQVSWMLPRAACAPVCMLLCKLHYVFDIFLV